MNLVLSAGDGFIIAMFAVMTLSLGMLAGLGISMWRNARRRDQQVDELLEEVSEIEKRGPAASDGPKPNKPWEREADWWKQ